MAQTILAVFKDNPQAKVLVVVGDLNVTISIGVRREDKLPKYFFHLQPVRYALNFLKITTY